MSQTSDDLNAATLDRERIEKTITREQQALDSARAEVDRAEAEYKRGYTPERAAAVKGAREEVSRAHVALEAARSAHTPAKKRELDAAIASVVASHRRP